MKIKLLRARSGISAGAIGVAQMVGLRTGLWMCRPDPGRPHFDNYKLETKHILLFLGMNIHIHRI